MGWSFERGDLEKSRWTRYDADATRHKFDELEFRQLLARFPLPDSVQVPLQPTLAFDPVAPAAGVRIVTPGGPELAELVERLDQSEEVGVFGLWDGPARGGQLVGLGFGFAEEYDVERKFRETRLYQIAPISTNLVLCYLAEHVLGLPRSY